MQPWGNARRRGILEVAPALASLSVISVLRSKLLFCHASVDNNQKTRPDGGWLLLKEEISGHADYQYAAAEHCWSYFLFDFSRRTH